MSGALLLINKPAEWTSFDVVKKIRNLIKKKLHLKKIKVGHAGTLDPLATGLLIVCTGKFTKRIDEIQVQKKVYVGEITLGATTPSYDKETEVDQTFDTSEITDEIIHKISKKFEGKIMQKPPIFSALKREGKRLYKYAREGTKIEINAREVEIEKFKITSVEMPKITFKVVCSKGTYIRSLAHDFGKELNNGAHLSSLRREMIGNFSLSDSISIDSFKENILI